MCDLVTTMKIWAHVSLEGRSELDAENAHRVLTPFGMMDESKRLMGRRAQTLCTWAALVAIFLQSLTKLMRNPDGPSFPLVN